MREQVAMLVALRRLTGAGFSDRLCLELPSFSGRHERQPLRIEERHISAARGVWQRQLEAFAKLDTIMATGEQSPSVKAAEVVLAMLRR